MSQGVFRTRREVFFLGVSRVGTPKRYVTASGASLLLSILLPHLILSFVSRRPFLPPIYFAVFYQECRFEELHIWFSDFQMQVADG